MRTITLISIIFLSFSGCCKKIDPDPVKERSVLIYMAANNNLSPFSKNNLLALKSGFLPSNGNIIVYQHLMGEPPKMFRLVKDKKTNTIEEEMIAEYPQNERSTDPAVLTRSLQLMKELYPAKDYGLILWSHGTGWVPPVGTKSFPHFLMEPYSNYKRLSISELQQTKSFGAYGSDPGMDITDLANAIPYRLSFLLFDACLMGGIETLYAMRDVTDYMVASPAEILGDGFPYKTIMQPLFLPQPDLTAVCNTFFNFYDEQTGLSRSATIALYDTKAVIDFADVVRTIYGAYREELVTFSPVDVQPYANTPLQNLAYYDLDDFVKQIANESDYKLFTSALEKVVIHKRSTDYFYSNLHGASTVPIKHFGGISTFIPYNAQSALSASYKETEWNRAVHLIE